MITFQKENYNSLFKDNCFLKLIEENFQETGVLNTSYKLAPKYELYKLLAEQNFLELYSVRNDTILIGFFIATITPHQHYDEVMVAETDTFFLSKNDRQGLTGYKFLKYVVNKLKQKVDIIFLTTNIKRDLSGILTRLDFKLTDYTYRLGVQK